MATTTNYGWTTPDDTALVKDGASAIRTLGSSVDTSVKALNPGTTAGDLDYYTAATTKSRIAIGTNGQVLTSNGSVPSWATPSSGGMTLISTTTLSGASTTVSSIPATYNNLVVIVRNYLPTDDTRGLNIRINGDSGARYAELSAFGISTTQTFGNTGISTGSQTDNAVTNNFAQIILPDYANTTTWKNFQVNAINTDSTTTTSFRASVIFGYYNQTGAISSLQFLASSGNMTSGSVLLYGVK